MSLISRGRSVRQKRVGLPLLMVLLLTLTGCQSAWYNVMEQAGIHKRDLLSQRVVAARDAQEYADEQFSSALSRYKSVVEVPEGELSEAYEALDAEYQRSEAAAERVSRRIDAIEEVAQALFAEWESELDQYQSEGYRRQSAESLDRTRTRYAQMIEAMHEVEQTMPPVLRALNDNVLFLRHNLNARAIGSLEAEVQRLEADVASLRARMRTAIERSNGFIREMDAP